MDGRGRAAQPGGFEPNVEWTADAGNAVDVGLRELSQRLDQLLISVEMLGSHGHWSAPEQPEPPIGQPEPLIYPQEPPALNWETYAAPPPPAPVYGGWEDPYEQGPPNPPTWEPKPGYSPTWEPESGYPPTWEPESGYPRTSMPESGYPPTSIEPAAWEQPFDPPAQARTWAPEIPPATPPAPLIEVASLDAGPFVDLIELRHFEEDLGELARVRDVRVRRFGHHRATIEVAVSSAPLLELELQLLGREMSVGATPEGEVVVELVPRIVPAEDDAGEATESIPLEDVDA